MPVSTHDAPEFLLPPIPDEAVDAANIAWHAAWQAPNPHYLTTMRAAIEAARTVMLRLRVTEGLTPEGILLVRSDDGRTEKILAGQVRPA